MNYLKLIKIINKIFYEKYIKIKYVIEHIIINI